MPWPWPASCSKKPSGTPEEAYLRYQRPFPAYPHGDMTAPARQRLNALARYAPPPPPGSAITAAAPPLSCRRCRPLRCCTGRTAGGKEARLAGVRFWSNPGYTRVALDLSANVGYTSNFLSADPVENLPPRLFLDIGPASLDPALTCADHR